MNEHLHGLLIAGGAGTRLWPLSRGDRPKQLLPLAGGERSLLQLAFGRLARSMPAEQIRVVTSRVYEAAVHGQLDAVARGYPRGRVLAEPALRDSGPAVLWGALAIAAEDPQALVAVVWADQLVRHEAAFDQALRQAAEAAQAGALVAVGVPADRPLTNLGYIQQGAAQGAGRFRAARFVEKPPLEQAQQMVADGGYLWNPGVFVFPVATLLAEFGRHAPDLLAGFQAHAPAPAEGAQGWLDPVRVAKVYEGLRRESLDYAVLEKTDRLELVPAQLGWSDLGTWDELYAQAAKDPHGNAITGPVATVDTHNSLIHAGRRLVATVGVESLVIIDTEDALLVCDMARVQDVKRLVNLLREQGRPQAERYEQTERPWGTYTVLYEAPGCKVKSVEVRPGQRLSLQLHKHRAEHWVVVSGRGRLTCGETVAEYGPGGYLHIPQGVRHRIENATEETLSIIEVQQGAYTGEDDIVRFEDVYGRT